MLELELDLFQSAALGAAVLILGQAIVKYSSLLRKFCIPAAVVGGITISILMLFLHEGEVMEIKVDNTIQTIAMHIFFCSIGFMASFKMLRAGGKLFLVMGSLILLLICMQDFIGMVCMGLFGFDPLYGLAVGSISMCGGHGTAAAYGDVLVNDYGLEGADALAIAAATFGLVIAGFIGGPIGRRLVRKNNLKHGERAFVLAEEDGVPINNQKFLIAMVAVVICLGLGTLINSGFDLLDISLPTYLGAMIVAIIVRNIADVVGYIIPIKEIEVLGWISLSLFLAMALMTVELWQLADLATPMLITLVIQAIALVCFVVFLVFRLSGANYESAVMSTGTIGFGMGATPNAIANMTAMMDEFGPAPVAYFTIPIVGGVLLDVLNVIVLTIILNIF